MVKLVIELVEGREGKIQRQALNTLLREQGFNQRERADELGESEKNIWRRDKRDLNTPCPRHLYTRRIKSLDSLSPIRVGEEKIYCPFCRIEKRFTGFFAFSWGYSKPLPLHRKEEIGLGTIVLTLNPSPR